MFPQYTEMSVTDHASDIMNALTACPHNRE